MSDYTYLKKLAERLNARQIRVFNLTIITINQFIKLQYHGKTLFHSSWLTQT